MVEGERHGVSRIQTCSNKDEGNMPSGECSGLSGLGEEPAIRIEDQIILNG